MVYNWYGARKLVLMTLNINFSEVLVVGVLCLCMIVDLGLLHRYVASENPFSHYGVVCAIYMCNVGDVGGWFI